MMRPFLKTRLSVLFATPAAALALLVHGQVDGSVAPDPEPPQPRVAYGAPQPLGNGTVRTYIVFDEQNPRAPIEVGVAMSETVMSGLPAPAAHAGHDAHDMSNMRALEMPAPNPTPYRFVRLDWNAAGHEPPGIYDLPHFDFHFYRIDVAAMNAIVPADPQYAQKAARYPAKQQQSQFFVDGATAAKAPADAVTVPQMGLHWLDVRSPELQGLVGNPQGYKPFTKTFILGTWDGEFIFDEPMITRAYLLQKSRTNDAAVRDEIVELPTPPAYAVSGYYPTAYRITWDAAAREYRVALTRLVWREGGR